MRCVCIESLDELADYEERWEALRKKCVGPIYTSFDLATLWLEAYGKDLTPQILAVEDQGDLVGMAQLYLKRHRTSAISISILSYVGQGGDLGFNNLRVLFEPSRPEVLDRIVVETGKLDWNIMQTSYMEDNWYNRLMVDRLKSSWNTQEIAPVAMTIYPFPESGDILGGFGKKTRSNIHNRMNNLEKADRVKLRPIPVDDLDRAIEIYGEQHIGRWQERGGSIFNERKNFEFLKRVLQVSLNKHFGFAYELLIDDQVAAQTFGFLEGDFARGYMMGMNNDFAKYSPGLLMMTYAMDDLRTKGVRAVDTGAGMEGYKQHMGGYQIPMIGLQAKRGMVSFLSNVANSWAARRIDSAFGLKGRLFNDIYE